VSTKRAGLMVCSSLDSREACFEASNCEQFQIPIPHRLEERQISWEHVIYESDKLSDRTARERARTATLSMSTMVDTRAKAVTKDLDRGRYSKGWLGTALGLCVNVNTDVRR
jgi:hypothetical protein